MAENNNIFLNNPFNFNMPLPQKTIQVVKKVIKEELGKFGINEAKDYFNDNDKVFSGEVAKEIKKYQAMIYSLGQLSREGQPTTTFKRIV